MYKGIVIFLLVELAWTGNKTNWPLLVFKGLQTYYRNSTNQVAKVH